MGERGVRVSGGEKQRIGLARAIYQDKPIIVFDEATSSLDNQTEKNILNSIIKIKKEKTLIIIAHRLSTLKNCDKVIYIENGQVKDQGKLDELLIKYPELENKNFSEKIMKKIIILIEFFSEDYYESLDLIHLSNF